MQKQDSFDKIRQKMTSLLLQEIFSVFSRAATLDLTEYFCVIVGIGKASFFSNTADGFFGIEIFQASLDPVFLQKRKKGSIHMAFKKTGTFTLAQMNMFGNIIQCNLIHIILFDVGENPADSFVFCEIRNS